MRTIGRVAMAAVLGLAACSEDLAPAKTAWNALVGELAGKVAKLQGEHEGLAKAVKELPAAEGEARVKLDEALKNQVAAFAALKEGFEKAKGAVDAAINAGKLDGVNAAINAAKASTPGAINKFQELLTANAKLLKDYEEAGKAAAAAADAEKAAAAAQASKLEELKKKGGALSFPQIQFADDKADLVATGASKEALDSIVALGKACKGIKLNIVGHYNKGGDTKVIGKLTESRAQAVKAYLVAQGVEAKAIGKVVGSGAKFPAVKDEADLANRRIEVQVAKPCK